MVSLRLKERQDDVRVALSVTVVAVDRLASNRITVVSRRKGRYRSMLILNDALPAKLGACKLKVRL